MIYIVGEKIYYFYLKFNKYLSSKLFIFLVFYLSYIILYNLVKFHPYQNVYFNYLIKHKANKYFEIDYWGLANREAIEFIIKDSKYENIIKDISINSKF